MSLAGTYDSGNIFARILTGEAEVATIWDDDQVLAFMDGFPQSSGHALVIPKAAARNLIDIKTEDLLPLITAVQRLTRAIARALEPDGISVLQFNGAVGGQTVFHLHFHVIPRWQEHAMRPHAQGIRADSSELRSLAKRIAAELD